MSPARTIHAAAVFVEPDFPLRVMRVPYHRSASLHRHEFHELVMILGGKGRHVTPDGAHPLEKGDVFLVHGETSHGYTDTKDMRLVNILFDPKRLILPLADLEQLPGYHVLFRLEPRLRHLPAYRRRLRLTGSQIAKVAPLISLLEDETRNRPPGYRCMATAHLSELICKLSRFCSEESTPAHRPLLRIGEILSHIEGNFDDRLTLPRLAEMAAMSESSLARVFRRAVGCPPVEYVIRVRIRKAREMLRLGDVRISDVAFRCGFNDSNYFSRQFGRVTGESPRAYRNRVAART